jgi:hypothetical protein
MLVGTTFCNNVRSRLKILVGSVEPLANAFGSTWHQPVRIRRSRQLAWGGPAAKKAGVGGPEGSKEVAEAPKALRRRTQAIPRVGPTLKIVAGVTQACGECLGELQVSGSNPDRAQAR